MSTQRTPSRREALSLIGITGSVAITTFTAQTAGARPDEAISVATSTKYIFGYGSLIERQSRMATWPSAYFASPVVVKGIARGWFDQTDVPSWSLTYLGGTAKQPNSSTATLQPVVSPTNVNRTGPTGTGPARRRWPQFLWCLVAPAHSGGCAQTSHPNGPRQGTLGFSVALTERAWSGGANMFTRLGPFGATASITS
jgi:hypothetical protein